MAEKYIKTSDCEKYFYEHLDDLHMAGAMNAIDEMPNEDVVPVVRCKNCKYVDNGYIGHLNCRFSILCPYLVWITANGANKKCLLLKKKWL